MGLQLTSVGFGQLAERVLVPSARPGEYFGGHPCYLPCQAPPTAPGSTDPAGTTNWALPPISTCVPCLHPLQTIVRRARKVHDRSSTERSTEQGKTHA